MTPRDFVKEIITQYHAARRSRYPHERVFRGGSRSVSSEAEDLLASYLIKLIPQDAAIYINQTITSLADGSRQCIKPDLVVVRGRTITAALDLKMDLGYQRDTFPSFWRDRDERARLLRGQPVTMMAGEEAKLQSREYTFGDQARFFFVLVSDRNISRKKFSAILALRETVECSDLFILTEREHPNVYGLTVDEALDRLTVNETEFTRLTESLNS